MKIKIILFFHLLVVAEVQAQGIASDYLDVNNIKARINASGDLFWDLANGQFEVPQGSGIHTIFADNLWIGGIDNGGQLKIAAQTYRQTGTDFWPGPLNNMALTDSAVMYDFNKLWKLRKCDIENYHQWIINGMAGPSPVDSITENTIVTWPGDSPFGGQLAPYLDFNSDGSYNVSGGDYPLIKGDQAIFFVYNDKGNIHTETGGSALGVEIQTMAYAYNCQDSALQNSIFVNYKIINRSSFQLNNTFIGKWTDFDIGGPLDDYIGCDVTRGAYYACNGDSNDVGGYGIHPAAQGVVFLRGAMKTPNGIDEPSDSTANGSGYADSIVDNEELGMTRFMYYNNNSHAVTGNPNLAFHYYNYLSGFWKDGTPWTYGGTGSGPGVPCDYMMPGDSDPVGFGINGGIPMTPWDEQIDGNIPGDRKGLAATGPFTFQPGEMQEFEIAYVFGRDYSLTGTTAGIQVMKTRIDSIRASYKNGIEGCGCNLSATGTEDISLSETALMIYPNPASEVLYVNCTSVSKNVMISVYDINGRLVMETQAAANQPHQLDIAGLSAGLYVVRIKDEEKMFYNKFIKH